MKGKEKPQTEAWGVARHEAKREIEMPLPQLGSRPCSVGAIIRLAEAD